MFRIIMIPLPSHVLKERLSAQGLESDCIKIEKVKVNKNRQRRLITKVVIRIVKFKRGKEGKWISYFRFCGGQDR